MTEKKIENTNKVKNFIIYFLVLIIVFGGIYFWMVINPTKGEVLITQEEIPVVYDQTEEIVAEEEATESTGSVQGVIDFSGSNSVNQYVPQPQMTIVTDGNTSSGFLVYTLQDTTSPVVYEAKDGETFDVVDESASWYKVKLANGREGWLLKSSVKSRETIDTSAQ